MKRKELFQVRHLLDLSKPEDAAMLLGGLWFSAETGWMQAGSHGEIENHIDAKDRDDYAKCCATLGPELAQRVKEYDNPLPRPAVAL